MKTNIIKLENIQDGQVVEEYVCSRCRHLVGSTDVTCWQCDRELELSDLVEHCEEGNRLTDKQFRDRKKELT